MARISPKTPNTGLSSLLEQAKYTQSQFANAVNHAGVAAGLDLRYDHSAVKHWLAGTQPKPQVRAVVVEVLARKLKRPVTHAEAGLTPVPDVRGGAAGDTVEDLVELGTADVNPSRRGVLAGGLYSAALAVPAFALATPAKAAAKSPARPTTRIGTGQVDTVRRMTDKIADILDELGAGHARPMAAAFLVNTVGPYLKATATGKVHADMLSAASDLTYLTGWMAMYEREHGTGQTYYLRALDLAREADDHVTYCRTLRGMSLQASNLRYGSKALEYADSAAEVAPSAGPRLTAFLRGQQAHAASMVGDKRQAMNRLRETEAALAKADNHRDAIGGYDQAAYQFHVAHVLYEFKDLDGSIKAMQHSLRVQPPQERQGRVHANGVLAQRQFELGHVEQACSTWGRFLDDYQDLSTARGDEHFATMRKRLAPYTKARAVRDLMTRAQDVAAHKA
ncbi:hypothetical protein [Streptomyces sp. WM6378]|uniref:hypothetical protein n=1 Tax=Streptomyces sp. WM6378 TaxID=1415557 RepID=UPI0006AF237E|nr:hypothetical protein [Streptomyces sp. WM6378]KOU43950.1 hypothetical protein ADK54_17060 [Streptomyces sp. WM6378]